MNVRDAVASDVSTLASIADKPVDAIAHLLRDRTVRVAEIEGDPDPDSDNGDQDLNADNGDQIPDAENGDQYADVENGEQDSNGEVTDSNPSRDEHPPGRFNDHVDDRILGFVSFDAHPETVHITWLAGTEEACSRLIEEPLRFAATEAMAVEFVVPETDEVARRAAERAELEEVGAGPRFDRVETVKYRLEFEPRGE